jgi:hypothetical protein
MTRTHRVRTDPFFLETTEAAAQRELDRTMAAWSIHPDGQGYKFNGRHYEQLSDAVRHAEGSLPPAGC